MNEDQILAKLDEIKTQGATTLVEVAKLQEQIKPISDHETRIRALEAWRWGLVGVSGLMATGFTLYSQTKGAA